MLEGEIIVGCINNKPLAQKALYARYAYKMMGVCLRYAQSREEAEDILQDAFIKIFTRIKSYKGEGSFEGWIRRIVVTTAIDSYNQQKKALNQTTYDDVPEAQEYGSQDIISQLSAEELMQTMSRLPDGYRMVMNLYAIEGYSHKEIGDMLHISEGTSKSQLSKGRKMLESMLEKTNVIVKNAWQRPE